MSETRTFSLGPFRPRERFQLEAHVFPEMANRNKRGAVILSEGTP